VGRVVGRRGRVGAFGATRRTAIGDAVGMTDTTERPASTSNDVVDEVRTWLEENWDPDLTVAEWWERLGLAGWSAPTLPENAYGRGLSRGDAVLVQNTIAEFGALGAPGGLGLLLAAPTIATHGTPEQIERYVRDIVTGQQAWCQLFSEPGAGSDLAGLQAKAMLDGEEYIVNGQKVWTSGGHYADLGMLIARTNSDVPKHQGITYFAMDMHQEGVDVRPLKELTGRALFNEVFMSDARVPADAVIGGLNNGWAVANTTLAHERAGLGAGGGSSSASAAIPGTVAGQLGNRAGDYVRDPSRPAAGGGAAFRDTSKMMINLAQGAGVADDPTIRQDLVRLYTMSQLGRINNLRVKAAKAKGEDIAGMGNIAKLSMSDMVRLQRDLGLRIVGPQGMLHAYDGEHRKALDAATGNPFLGFVTEMALFAQAPPIYGGTDQVQKNIIGERVLGLPKEPNQDKVVPFSELPKNA
jgi:alkylation response protein AidB-like acyl-CoA dehydrogenase